MFFYFYTSFSYYQFPNGWRRGKHNFFLKTFWHSFCFNKVDIDLNDPEVGKAAVKIQAGFKNFMARKKDPPKEEEKEKEVPKTKEEELEEGIVSKINIILK